MPVLPVFLTLFLPPLGLSSSQVEVEMLHSAGVKGDALPVCRTSRRAVFPCLGGPIISIFSSLKGSAFRRFARRKARTDAGPEKRREVEDLVCTELEMTLHSWHHCDKTNTSSACQNTLFSLLYIFLTAVMTED